MFNNKIYRVSFVLFLCISTLVGCAKIEYKEDCAPRLTYEFSEDAEFIFVESSEGVNMTDFLRDNEMSTLYVFEWEGYGILKEDTFHADQLTLTGNVIKYKKSLLGFDSSGVYFEVLINDKFAWISGTYLHLITLDHATEMNKYNKSQLSDDHDMRGKFKCIKNNNLRIKENEQV